MQPTRPIIQVIARLNVGGPAVHVALVASRLEGRGHAVRLVTGRVGPHEGDMSYYARARGVEPLVLDDLGREIRPLRDLRLVVRLYRLFRGLAPSVVHTHTAKAGTLGRLAAWLAGVPVIVHTFHGHVLTHYFGPFRSWLFLGIERVLARITTHIVVLGEAQKDEISRLGIGSPDRVAVIPLGLELDELTCRPRRPGTLHARLGRPPATRLVGMVARMVAVKRHGDFCAAAARVAAGRDDVDFVLVGDGELRPEIEEQVRRLGLPDRFHFLGWQDDMAAVYPDLDVLVLTSANEGLPTAIIEAMACGVPVVSTRVGSVGELLEDGSEGRIVAPGDVGALADAILEILSDPAAADAMGTRCRTRALATHGVDRMVSDIEGLYRRLLGEERTA